MMRRLNALYRYVLRWEKLGVYVDCIYSGKSPRLANFVYPAGAKGWRSR